MPKTDHSFNDTTPFGGPYSTIDNPRLEFAMEVRLTFPEVYTLANVPSGGMRSAVLVSGGTFEGPLLKGRAVPGSGGDYAYFRPDDVAVFDARYLLEEDDGTLILLDNRGWITMSPRSDRSSPSLPRGEFQTSA